MGKENKNGKAKGNAIALLPIVVAFLAAILVACLQNRVVDFDQKLEIMARGVGDKNIITMLLLASSVIAILRNQKEK